MFINLLPIAYQQPCCVHEHRQIKTNKSAIKEQSLMMPKKKCTLVIVLPPEKATENREKNPIPPKVWRSLPVPDT